MDESGVAMILDTLCVVEYVRPAVNAKRANVVKPMNRRNRDFGGGGVEG